MSVETENAPLGPREHVVHFYDDDTELCDAVVPFLSAAIQAGAVAIVLATRSHRRAFAAQLEASGVDVAQARAGGQLVSLDAAETMAQLMSDGEIDAAAFHELVGAVIGRAAACGRAVRVYGEVVALLWQAGDVIAAIELERLWNDLAHRLRFELLCAYPAPSVSGSEHADALQELCSLHSAAHPRSDRATGQSERFADGELAADFPASREAPGVARRMLIGELRRWGHEESFVHDAALVLSELASNAVRHAGTPFSIAVRMQDPILRIAVRDAQTLAAIGPRGELLRPRATHGLAVIDALAADWGVEHTFDGKVVWAQLRTC